MRRHHNDISPQGVRERVVDRLLVEMPGFSLNVGNDHPYRIQLLHPEAGELVLNLGNLIQEVRTSSPEMSDALIAAFVTMAKRALEPPAVNLSNVYPALRHHGFLDGVEMADDDPLIGEGPGDLISVVLADVGDGLATLTQEAADRSRLQPVQILTAAEENFVKLLPHEVVSCEPAEGVVSIGLENHPWLGTSLLFVPSLLSQVMSDRGWNRALVAAPTRESVDLVRADRANAVDVMQGWMQMRLSGPRSLSEVVLTMERGDENLSRSHIMADQRLLGLN